LAKQKGTIDGEYPVVFHGVRYSDAEAAFHAHTMGMSFEYQQEICAQIVEAKFRQHPV
jgi:hypothetical protein